MTNDNYTQRLKELVDNHHTQYGKFIRRPENKDLLDFINSYESDKLTNNNLQTKIYWILNDLHDFPDCHNPDCTNKVTSNVRGIYKGYGTSYPTCCSACAKHTPEYLKNWGDSLEEKYGSRHPMHCQEIKDKVRITTEERWGGIGFASEELNAKERQIFKEKYNSEDPGNLPEFREKARQTSMDNWGVDNPMKCDEIKQRVIDTNRKLYGKDFYQLTEEGQERRIQTCIDKFGGRCPLCDPSILQKAIDTKMSKYGHPFFGSSFGSTTSKGEKEVLEFVKTIYSGIIIENDRTQMTPNDENKWIENHELDIWLPEIKVAIEYNGTYWHSLPERIASDKFKRLQCESNGIQLVVITEHEWSIDRRGCEELLRRIVNSL